MSDLMNSAVKWILIVAVGIPVAVLLADRILLKLEERGWIFYRRNKPNFKNAGGVFLELQAMFDPKARYVIERKEKEEHEEDADEDGDPPVPGADARRP
jgi:hypothetical protein